MHCRRRRGCFSTNHHNQQSTWSPSLGMPYPTNSTLFITLFKKGGGSNPWSKTKKGFFWTIFKKTAVLVGYGIPNDIGDVCGDDWLKFENIFFCACNAYYGLQHLKIQIEPIFPQLLCERPKVDVHINSFVWAFIVSAEAHKSGWPETLGFLIVSFLSKYNFLEPGNIKKLYTNKAQKRNTFTKAQLVQRVWRLPKPTSSLNFSTWTPASSKGNLILRKHV